ncbi:MAG: hypothetical protein HOP11_08315 [Saprospiraceae bacterium]|nr:hypothetical protein [Saprospiraceae bacterium]
MKFAFVYLVLFISCSNPAKIPTTLTGNYELSLNLKDKSIEAIHSMKDSVKIALQAARAEMRNAKIDNEIDLNKIDTSTSEGKIEYVAKALSKTLTDSLIPQFDLLADGISGLVNNTGDIGVNMLEAALRLVTINISLKEDGTISTNQELIKAQFNTDLKWKQEGERFILMNSEGSAEQIFTIQNHQESGFDLVNDKIILNFSKK